MGKFFIHKSSFLDSSSKVGAGTKIWHFCNVLSNVIIGENCVLGQNIFIGRNVFIGNNVKIQNNVSIYDGINCQDDVFIGPSVVFTNVINPRSFIERKDEFKKTELSVGCSIGANATIICGNNIGQYSLIGAGSVVNRDVKNLKLYGNPIRHIGWIDVEGLTDFKSKKCFMRKYILENNSVKIKL